MRASGPVGHRLHGRGAACVPNCRPTLTRRQRAPNGATSEARACAPRDLPPDRALSSQHATTHLVTREHISLRCITSAMRITSIGRSLNEPLRESSARRLGDGGGRIGERAAAPPATAALCAASDEKALAFWSGTVRRSESSLIGSVASEMGLTGGAPSDAASRCAVSDDIVCSYRRGKGGNWAAARGHQQITAVLRLQNRTCDPISIFKTCT